MPTKVDPLAFYQTAAVLFTLIGVSTVIQDIAPGQISTRRGRTTWVCADLALTIAGLLMLVAGEVLVQTVLARKYQVGHEHGATVILLCATGGCVIAKLVLRRAFAIGWKRKRGQDPVPDTGALIKLGIAFAAGLGVGAAAIAAVIARSEQAVPAIIVTGLLVTMGAIVSLVVKIRNDKPETNKVRHKLRQAGFEPNEPERLDGVGYTMIVPARDGNHGNVAIYFFDSNQDGQAYIDQHHLGARLARSAGSHFYLRDLDRDGAAAQQVYDAVENGR